MEFATTSSSSTTTSNSTSNSLLTYQSIIGNYSMPSTSQTTSILFDTVRAAQMQMSKSVNNNTAAAEKSVPSPKGEKCVGCGSESSIRVHYGASSCHGCKAFFRRSVFEGRVYVCSVDNNCEITNESRNRCRACRLRNCLEGGMNPKHVREERNKIDKLPANGTKVTAVSNPPTSLSPCEGVSPPRPHSSSVDSESDVSDRKIPAEEHELTTFMKSLEKQTERLTDEDVNESEAMADWSRDITLTFGLQNPNMVVKRLPLIYTCDKIMEASDLYLSWYRSFVFCADWAMGIPDFRVLSLNDQTALFKQNFMAFGWITLAYKCFELKQHNIGVPLGNGAYIPYLDEEQKKMPERWCVTYGVVCKKLIELIVRTMIELEMSEEEYCLLKTIALFQADAMLSEHGNAVCNRMKDRVLEALSIHIERRFPNFTQTEITMRAMKISLLLPSFSHVGQLESILIQQLTATDLHQLSGVPMEICSAQQIM